MTLTTNPSWPNGFRVMITGHRQLFSPAKVKETLAQILVRLQAKKGPLLAFSGMAMGADLEFVDACVEAGVPVIGAIPMLEQDSRWPSFIKDRYREALAKTIHNVAVWQEPSYGSNSVMAAFHLRNKWMVDRIPLAEGLVLSVWDGRTSGGTYSAIREAQRQMHKVMNIHPVTGVASILDVLPTLTPRANLRGTRGRHPSDDHMSVFDIE